MWFLLLVLPFVSLLPTRVPNVVQPNYEQVTPLELSELSDISFLYSSESSFWRRLNEPFINISPTVIPFGTDSFGLALSSDEIRSIYRYVFRSLSYSSTRWILHPYSLDLVAPEGGLIDLDGLTEEDDHFFSQVLGEISLSRSQALYDTTIVVVRLSDPSDGSELFFESDTYCAMSVTYVGHWGTECIYSSDPSVVPEIDSILGGANSRFVYADASSTSSVSLSQILESSHVGILVIPDYILGQEEKITQMIGEDNIAAIRNFVEVGGGVVYASGKAGKLLMGEEWGIVPPQTYLEGTVITSRTNEAGVVCGSANGPGATVETFEAFVARLYCFGTPEKAYMLASYRTASDLPEGVMPLVWFDSGDPSIRFKDLGSGLYSDVTGNEPAALMYNLGKGVVLLNHFNPGYHTDSFGWFYAGLFVAMGKSALINRAVEFQPSELLGESFPIPAMESGVVLSLTHEFRNLFTDGPIDNLAISFWLPNLVSVLDSPGVCQNLDLGTPPVAELDQLNAWLCDWATVDAYGVVEFSFRIEILDASVTQKKTGVVIGYTQVDYTQSRTDLAVSIPVAELLVDTQVAPVLRGGINPDPSSFYPLEGQGVYIDNVLPVENKEPVLARDVEFISVVPIISPAVDGNDQRSVIDVVRFWPEYYTAETNGAEEYPYPFVHDSDYDFLDYRFLTDKGVMLTANWDTPVKMMKMDRDLGDFPVLNLTASLGLKNINYSTSVSKGIVLQQIHYANADSFFEHAAQQMLVYVDTNTQEGADAFYGNNITVRLLSDLIVPNRTVEKKEFVFVRNDIYFYDSGDQYLLPLNLNYSHVISIDRYPTYPGGACSNDAAGKLVVGYFNKSLGGLKYNEYANEVTNRCDKVVIPFDEIDSFTSGSVTKTDYVIPIVDQSITKASDLMFFDEETGEFENYPELKFIYAHSFILPLDPALSRRGGKFIFSVPGDGSSLRIHFSADHVAYYDHEIVGSTITAFFKRGLLPNENWGKVSLQTIVLSNVDSEADRIPIDVDVYELKYDLSASFGEQFLFRETISVNATRSPHFLLPAIRMRFVLNRTREESLTPTSMMPYELIEPLARYGVYHQELVRHTTVFGLAESHVVKDPGIVVSNGGFSVISQVGISSIPFIDYLTVGSGQVIPAGVETSRIEWTDLWNRRWMQPTRSVFPDVPPIPPPLRNFMMTTTFELTKAGTTERVLEWSSTEDLDIRVHIKLKNNYPKHFEITTCPENRIFSIEDSVRARVFDWPFPSQVTSEIGDELYLSVGHRSFYGDCFTEPETILSGEPLTPEMQDLLPSAWHCSQNLLNSSACVEGLLAIPTVSRRSTTPPAVWNYSPEVEQYYGTDYVKGNMWDLTHYDYDDNAFDKAYKYHMDNLLPNLDLSILKPHNIIAQPIWKGHGYKITYDKTYSVARYGSYSGWWSDNLQNKDHTVLAGHAVSYDISVDKASDSLIPAWIPITSLDDTGSSKFARVANTLTNIYACEFNRHRIRMRTDLTKKVYPANILQNNVIPIIPELDRYDERYDNYACDLGKEQYTPFTISDVDNRVETTDGRDWLYFGANLRGNAKETVNVVYHLEPFADRLYEGDTKVNDGGRFVYWNPANGPNSFLIVDNPVNVVKATRCDMTMDVELFPKDTLSFDADVYHLVRFADDEEIDRQVELPIYINHYGFGDASTSVYVGGVEGTSSILQPGQSTYVKVTLYNNAGFDWNLKPGAIEFQYEGSAPLNADALLKDYVHSIQFPTRYNFLTLSIPSEIAPYVDILPSDHNKKVVGLFFDFQNINTVTVMDGFKADYFYRVDIDPSFPSNLRGRMHRIGVSLNVTDDNFESLPGFNDPTTAGYHDYTLEIPDFAFGVPFGSEAGEHQGKVFEILGQSSDLSFTLPLSNEFTLEGPAKVVTLDEIDELRTIAADPNNLQTDLRTFFDALPGSTVSFTSGSDSGSFTSYHADVSTTYDVYPKRMADFLPPEAETFLLFRTHADVLNYGSNVVDNDPLWSYRPCGVGDSVSLSMSSLPKTRSVTAQGPYLEAEWQGELLTRVLANGIEVENKHQNLYPSETGTMRITLTITNVGSDIAFNLNLTCVVDPKIEVLLEQMDETAGFSVVDDLLVIDTQYNFAPSWSETYTLVIRYFPAGVEPENAPPSRSLIDLTTGHMDLTATDGDVRVSQALPNYAYAYTRRDPDTVILDVTEHSSKLCRASLQAIPNHPLVEDEPIYYLFYQKNTTASAYEFIVRQDEATLTVGYPCVAQHWKVVTQDRVTEFYLAEAVQRMGHFNAALARTIAIGVVGGIAGVSLFALFLVLVIIAIVCICKRRRLKKAMKDEVSEPPTNTDVASDVELDSDFVVEVPDVECKLDVVFPETLPDPPVVVIPIEGDEEWGEVDESTRVDSDEEVTAVPPTELRVDSFLSNGKKKRRRIRPPTAPLEPKLAQRACWKEVNRFVGTGDWWERQQDSIRAHVTRFRDIPTSQSSRAELKVDETEEAPVVVSVPRPKENSSIRRLVVTNWEGSKRDPRQQKKQ